MTTFQILTLIISGLFLFGSIITVYVACRVALAKLEVEVIALRRDLMAKEIAILNIEKWNREDHKTIIEKIDKLYSDKIYQNNLV